ncbi:hypothetical protein QLQ12_39785 [Actinoplanes sp. NEAU-A12]|uniref:Uncharacterized protein n=1 Tax=Actinoplanes sandaracinus TaxID=3045177 RepID=A0ABT6WYR3_9ACTN|nr:hypothetical protein [Actinoplanes sandaracinus]MDI6104750.1 hypothetical protein [Actinoplanes sandaracinus]
MVTRRPSAGSRATGNEFFLSAGGEPYPLQIVGLKGSRTTLSEFGATFGEIATPPADQVFDMAKVPGRR